MCESEIFIDKHLFIVVYFLFLFFLVLLLLWKFHNLLECCGLGL
jgi:hypothetical protein